MLDKEKLAIVLEKILDRLDIIDAGQARVLGNTVAMRDSLHSINNELTTIKLNQAMDTKEIAKILKLIDGIAKRVDGIAKSLNEGLLKEFVKDVAAG